MKNIADMLEDDWRIVSRVKVTRGLQTLFGGHRAGRLRESELSIRQATNKIVGISDEAAAFLGEFF